MSGPNQKYELEHVWWPEHGHESMIGTLTGLPLEDILKVTSKMPEAWSGQMYIKVLRKLGFNTNNRFVKFDPETPYPCIIRMKSHNPKDPNWYAAVYNDGTLYNQDQERDFEREMRHVLGKYFTKTWQVDNIILRVSSMLQVWI